MLILSGDMRDYVQRYRAWGQFQRKGAVSVNPGASEAYLG